EGFRQALARHGIDPDSAPAPEVANWHRTDGRRAAHVLSAEHPEVDGIVCGNDELALGVLTGLRDVDRRVPDQVAVIGYDDSPDAPFAYPSLSSISPDKTFLARLALDMLGERIAGYEGPPRMVTAPYQLIARDSAAAARCPRAGAAAEGPCCGVLRRATPCASSFQRCNVSADRLSRPMHSDHVQTTCP